MNLKSQPRADFEPIRRACLSWAIWSRQMRSFLMARGLWYVVHNGVAEEGEGTAETLGGNATQDQQALSTIFNAIDLPQYEHIRSASTSKEAWNRLKQVHEATPAQSADHLLKQFWHFSVLPGDKVEDVVSRLNVLQAAISFFEESGIPSDAAKTVVLLRSMGDDFSTVRAELQVDRNLTFERAVDSFKECEQMMNDQNPLDSKNPTASY